MRLNYPVRRRSIFKKVDLTCERLKYDYAKGCRLVGETTKEEKMRELLLRFSSSLLSGEPEADFLVREAKAQAEDYDNEYGRKVEASNYGADAYVSLILIRRAGDYHGHCLDHDMESRVYLYDRPGGHLGRHHRGRSVADISDVPPGKNGLNNPAQKSRSRPGPCSRSSSRRQ